MKGIQKLFLGLFLVALISVGFKVEAKAGTGAPVLTLLSEGTDLKLEVDASGTDIYPEDSSGAGKYKAFEYTLTVTDSGGQDKTIKVRLIKEGSDKKYSVDGGAITDGDKAKVTIIGKEAMITRMNALGRDTLAYTVTGTGAKVPEADPYEAVTGTPANPAQDSITILGKVTLAAEYTDGSFPSGAKTVVFSENSPFYLLSGEYSDVSVTTSPGPGYAIDYWKINSENKGATTPCRVSMGDPATAMNVVVMYKKNENGFKVTGTGFKDLKVLAGKYTNSRSYTIAGYTINDVQDIYIGSTSVGKSNIEFTPSSATAGTMRFKAPANAVSGKMYILMNDGQKYDLADKAEVISKVYITLESSYNLSPDSNYIITPGVSPDPDDITYSFSPDPSSFMTPTVDADDNLLIATKSSTGTTKVTATAKFSDIEGGTSGTAEATATATITVESLIIKDGVFVNKGLSILLSKFIKSGSSTAETQVTQYPDLIKIDPTSGKVNGIKISGESAGTKDDSLVVSTQTGKIDVTVYPSPTLSVETSTSGPYKYTVKVPKGLYHDDVFVSEVSKAVLEFKAIDHDDKTKKVTIDSLSDDSDNKLLKKGTKSIELKDLNKYIKDIAKDTDTQTIQVRAYAYNKDKDEKDDKVYSEKKEFTVYKINLDTSGNASYTVNGENVGGYFYGISDATYTIKSTATNGGKLDTTKSGDFNSGESISYKVLGARTLKAVYTAGGANANTTGGAAGAGMDGYDDVPKTGESRADIWILWSVLLVSILGAGFMIWKRFGLVRAIAAADEEMAQAQEKERVEAEKKAEKDKMDMLKDLRNL